MRFKIESIALALLFSFFHLSTARASWEAVDLHAHLFMKEGMGWTFQGEFLGDLKAKEWSDRYRSKINFQTLENSGARVVVAALYRHPLFTMSLRDSVRRQISIAHQFVNENSNWIIAKSSTEARMAINKGKHVLVLALEGAEGIIENDQDIEEFIDTAGIRIITPLHLSDDRFGGVAFLKGPLAVSSPFALIESFFQNSVSNGIRVNPNGLTDYGKKMIQKWIDKKVWIDLAHASDESQREIVPLLKKAGQPLLYTHTVLREFHDAERGISKSQLKEVQKTKGIIGLMPSETMLKGTPADGNCKESIYSMKIQFNQIAKLIGADSIAIGSDFNGTLDHLRPPPCPTGTALDAKGLWSIAQEGILLDALSHAGGQLPPESKAFVSRFLEAWSRVQDE